MGDNCRIQWLHQGAEALAPSSWRTPPHAHQAQPMSPSKQPLSTSSQALTSSRQPLPGHRQPLSCSTQSLSCSMQMQPATDSDAGSIAATSLDAAVAASDTQSGALAGASCRDSGAGCSSAEGSITTAFGPSHSQGQRVHGRRDRPDTTSQAKCSSNSSSDKQSAGGLRGDVGGSMCANPLGDESLQSARQAGFSSTHANSSGLSVQVARQLSLQVSVSKRCRIAHTCVWRQFGCLTWPACHNVLVMPVHAYTSMQTWLMSLSYSSPRSTHSRLD